MFDNLTDRLSKSIQKIRGQANLSEDNIKEALREVRVALLEADVALPVVKSFIEDVRERALGTEVLTSLKPAQVLVKVVQEELVKVLGEETSGINFNAQPPVVILMAGLQGAGKTTTTGKLAKFLKERENKKVMVVSADVYRPAAIEQLQTVAEQVGVEWFPSSVIDDPVTIGMTALQAAKKGYFDVLIVDTAGRLAVDEAMMKEIKSLQNSINPTETLFVVDAMTGQDAANTAKAFSDALDLTGVVLTKVDGDARGGAALSVKNITGKPIKFQGVGEKMEALEPFHPDRIASSILGMGDVLSLVEEVERKVDKKEAEKLAKKVATGNKFTLEDFQSQLLQMQNMGGMSSMLDKLPGMSNLPDMVKDQVNDKSTGRMLAVISSMTLKEKRYPQLIKGSRKRRIANGSGTTIQDVSKLLKQYNQMQKMMRKFKGKGMMKMMQKLGGKLPGGMPF
ncbi:signal recognition particle protein [Marinicella sp. S1101]|uniref:signal recognition particle protein n=1 Tax=Marinicella marina TaxID=2996016 RepID=UPI002260B2AD|nr:signal recognition particle protein [Marinicella marina]MCX7554659.1 signal recognition particle protein [Marinicella marina]MDJ1140724.1 signal recognition particle protein [Marinicella marina]